MDTFESPTEARGGTVTALRDHLLYLLVVAVYCLPYLFQRDLFFRDESRYGAIVKEMIRNDAWFTMTISGDYYFEKPPLFFSLIRLAVEVAGRNDPWVFFLVVTLTALFFVAACDAFLRDAGFDRRTVLSANLLLLAVPWIAVHMQVLRMDLLFSALILLSVTSYVRGVDRPAVNPWPLIGGLLAGLAVLVKGPFGGLFPLATMVVYLVATHRARLLVRADLLSSLALLALPNLAWLAGVYATFGFQSIQDLFSDQIVERAVSGRHSQRPVWLYALGLALTAMPWLLLTPVLLVERLRHAVLDGFGTAPAPPAPGWRLVIGYFAISLVILALVAQRHIHFLLPLIPGLMVVVAIFYLRLDATAPRLVDWFYLGLAIVALVAPPLCVWAFGFAPAKAQAGVTNYIRPETLTHAAAALSLTAIPLAVAARLRGVARLFAGVVAVAIMVVAIKAIALPDIDHVYSPRHMATAFERHVPEGQPILVYDVYWGSLSYHFDRPLIYVAEPAALADALAEPSTPDYVIAPESAWTGRPDLWLGFERIDRGRLETTDLVLLRRTVGG